VSQAVTATLQRTLQAHQSFTDLRPPPLPPFCLLHSHTTTASPNRKGIIKQLLVTGVELFGGVIMFIPPLFMILWQMVSTVLHGGAGEGAMSSLGGGVAAASL
jgi:hypothetical protein